ncbi:MAG: amidase [Sphingomonadaceae bacterium]
MTGASINWNALEWRNEQIGAFLDLDRNAQPAPGVLSGVTFGVKANIMVRGLPFHAGLADFRHRIAERDALVVKRLRDAGGVILGTLNMEEAALGSKCDNPHFGAVQNPHRIGWSPGGSSGGSGAAVAAYLCDAALGTDTMGSIRIPASHCGVYGFKPANSRVSQDGLEPADLMFDAIGPMARDLDLLERIVSIMSDMGNGTDDLEGAVLVDHGVTVDPEVTRIFERALAELRQQPAAVKLDHPNSRIRFAGFIQVARAMFAHLERVAGLSPHLQRLLAYGPERSAEKWQQDRAVLEQTRQQVQDIVTRFGWLFLPTVPNLPFPHSQAEPPAQADFTCLANIAGLPSLSLPAGWSNNGLPVGVQIIARSGYEAGLFALARDLDQRLGAYHAPQIQGV